MKNANNILSSGKERIEKKQVDDIAIISTALHVVMAHTSCTTVHFYFSYVLPLSTQLNWRNICDT